MDKQKIIDGFEQFINTSNIIAISIDETISNEQFSPIYQAMHGDSSEIKEKTITIKYYKEEPK